MGGKSSFLVSNGKYSTAPLSESNPVPSVGYMLTKNHATAGQVKALKPVAVMKPPQSHH